MSETFEGHDAVIPHLLRVEKGEAGPEELAAITAVLLARAAGAADAMRHATARRERAVARWRRPERAPGFTGPRTWSGTRAERG
ncbi:acyl-CoA carboxylase subunit epsilon [Streptomyces sp. NPDC005474]|uniref:acyl-CoA carboxylase subunit epsilon n=1 Tax=Streptomyces sp. NPDC005474 TaxID=3154878 RepID=UPI0034570027